MIRIVFVQHNTIYIYIRLKSVRRSHIFYHAFVVNLIHYKGCAIGCVVCTVLIIFCAFFYVFIIQDGNEAFCWAWITELFSFMDSQIKVWVVYFGIVTIIHSRVLRSLVETGWHTGASVWKTNKIDKGNKLTQFALVTRYNVIYIGPIGSGKGFYLAFLPSPCNFIESE